MTYELFIRLIAPYHAVLVHFPVAIWTTVSLIVIYRALFDNALSRAGDRILVPLLALSIVAGIAAYTAGFIIFPVDATTASPLIRNHLLAASWSLAYWTVFLITRWLNGESVWVGAKRWIMLGLALLGTLLITVTGTVGGHIAGNPSTVSVLLQWAGWDVYDTFYVPDVVLWAIAAGVVLLPLLGWWGSRQRTA